MATVVELGEQDRDSMRQRADHLVLSGLVESPDRPRWQEFRFALSIVSTFCVTSAVVLIAWIVIPALVPAWHASAVQSASMEPAIERGDVVVFHPARLTPLLTDSVISFQRQGESTSVVHRIVNYDEVSDSYVTRGDANFANDSDRVSSEHIEGVGALLIPVIGYPVLWVQERSYLYLLALALGSGLVLVSSQTAPQGLASERGPQVRGALTPLHSAAANPLPESLFPADVAARLSGAGGQARQSL